jgi:hypothetical protein
MLNYTVPKSKILLYTDTNNYVYGQAAFFNHG